MSFCMVNYDHNGMTWSNMSKVPVYCNQALARIRMMTAKSGLLDSVGCPPGTSWPLNPVIMTWCGEVGGGSFVFRWTLSWWLQCLDVVGSLTATYPACEKTCISHPSRFFLEDVSSVETGVLLSRDCLSPAHLPWLVKISTSDVAQHGVTVESKAS